MLGSEWGGEEGPLPRKPEEMGSLEVGPPEVTSYRQPEVSAHILASWSSDRGTSRGFAGHVYEICSAGKDFLKSFTCHHGVYP